MKTRVIIFFLMFIFSFNFTALVSAVIDDKTVNLITAISNDTTKKAITLGQKKEAIEAWISVAGNSINDKTADGKSFAYVIVDYLDCLNALSEDSHNFQDKAFLAVRFISKADFFSVLKQNFALELLKFLKTKDFDFGLVDNDGKTVLHLLAYKSLQHITVQRKACLEFLIKSVSKEVLNLRDKTGKTALYLFVSTMPKKDQKDAVAQEDEEIIKAFLSQGAFIDGVDNNQQQTMLFSPVSRDFSTVVKMLVTEATLSNFENKDKNLSELKKDLVGREDKQGKKIIDKAKLGTEVFAKISVFDPVAAESAMAKAHENAQKLAMEKLQTGLGLLKTSLLALVQVLKKEQKLSEVLDEINTEWMKLKTGKNEQESPLEPLKGLTDDQQAAGVLTSKYYDKSVFHRDEKGELLEFRAIHKQGNDKMSIKQLQRVFLGTLFQYYTYEFLKYDMTYDYLKVIDYATKDDNSRCLILVLSMMSPGLAPKDFMIKGPEVFSWGSNPALAQELIQTLQKAVESFKKNELLAKLGGAFERWKIVSEKVYNPLINADRMNDFYTVDRIPTVLQTMIFHWMQEGYTAFKQSFKDAPPGERKTSGDFLATFEPSFITKPYYAKIMSKLDELCNPVTEIQGVQLPETEG